MKLFIKIIFCIMISISMSLMTACDGDFVASHQTSAPLNTNVVQTSAPSKIDAIQTPAPFYPNQSYIGTWYTSREKLDSLKISEITTDTVKFYMGIFRTVGIEATAKIENNEIHFTDDGPKISGTLEFNENSILVKITKSEFGDIEVGTILNFTVKGKN